MPVREKSYLRALFAGEQMRLGDNRPVQAWNQAPSEQWGSGTASNRQRIQRPAPQIVAFPRRGLYELFIPRFMPLHTPLGCATEVAAVV